MSDPTPEHHDATNPIRAADNPAVPAPSGPARLVRRCTRRDVRVVALVAMILIVSMADLYMTLTYLRNGGMAEGNPIARLVMQSGHPWVLVLFKCSLVGFTCTVLYWFRRRLTTELAAWVCCAAMTALCFQWSHYTEQINEAIESTPELTQVSTWVEFDN